MSPLRALVCLPALAWANLAVAQVAPAAPALPGVSAGATLQVVVGLVLVLGAVVGVAWLLRRLHAVPGVGNQSLRVVGGVAVGQRERVVVLEVEGTWLVVGVAPGRVNALHALPRPAHAPQPSQAAPVQPAFAAWLRQVMERRHNA